MLWSQGMGRRASDYTKLLTQLDYVCSVVDGCDWKLGCQAVHASQLCTCLGHELLPVTWT